MSMYSSAMMPLQYSLSRPSSMPRSPPGSTSNRFGYTLSFGTCLTCWRPNTSWSGEKPYTNPDTLAHVWPSLFIFSITCAGGFITKTALPLGARHATAASNVSFSLIASYTTSNFRAMKEWISLKATAFRSTTSVAPCVLRYSAWRAEAYATMVVNPRNLRFCITADSSEGTSIINEDIPNCPTELLPPMTSADWPF